jgi:hypothetical protein
MKYQIWLREKKRIAKATGERILFDLFNFKYYLIIHNKRIANGKIILTMNKSSQKMSEKPKSKTMLFNPATALAKMIMYPYPNTSQTTLTRYSLMRYDNKGMNKAVSGLKRLTEKPEYRGKFKTIIIYENKPGGIEITKAIDGIWK